ncbi:Extracellular solute-binding protein, family 3 [Desulfosarcina cetonica]|uniref:ABC transporter substrate-binding protein n=1 Tax=Desulfosarcina cetonica TaxID=90730 RepID=UPI0006D25C10|nr:ABC transporter substrate-binding protein [Desulfosarcina cetonica]VTR66735.1 Extracellular solute-binding protein, family 3 [Desulfosarcina cetonica]
MALKKKIIVGTIVGLLMVLHGFSWADGTFDKVKNKGELVVGLCAQYPPFESKNEKNGELEGFDIALGKALADQMGVKAKFIDAEWQGLLGGLKKGDYDVLITCMSKSETRSENVNFSDVYYTLPDVIVVRKDETVIKDRADLKDRRIGVQLGSGSEQIADKMKGMFKEIKRYNYNPEAFTDLKFKRVDAVLVGYAYAVNQIKTDPSYKVVGTPLSEAEIVMVLPKGADSLTSQLNDALAKIKGDGTYQQIHDRWLKID